jgi:tetratricopeptide (TPR) repeat protein
LGQYEKALEFFHLAQRGSEETLGLANISTMTLASNLAIVYCRLRRFEDALKWGLHCVEVCKGLYGLLHKYTLHEVSNVIEIYGKLGMVEEALQLARDLVDGYVGCMGRTIRTHRRR